MQVWRSPVLHMNSNFKYFRTHLWNDRTPLTESVSYVRSVSDGIPAWPSRFPCDSSHAERYFPPRRMLAYAACFRSYFILAIAGRAARTSSRSRARSKPASHRPAGASPAYRPRTVLPPPAPSVLPPFSVNFIPKLCWAGPEHVDDAYRSPKQNTSEGRTIFAFQKESLPRLYRGMWRKAEMSSDKLWPKFAKERVLHWSSAARVNDLLSCSCIFTHKYTNSPSWWHYFLFV